MKASDYLRVKFQNDRQLALATQNAVGGVLQSARGVASDIYSGMERASWYSSCFIPQYNDICQELKSEEIRTLYSIESIYRYRDVITYMLYLYFITISDDVDEGNPEGSARQFIRKMSALATHMNIAGGTRYAFASAASIALSQSGFMSKIIVERLSAKLPQAVFLLQFFGVQQKCALAARRLKTLDPKYYATLYAAQLEMLYYFFEPFLSELIKKVQMGFYKDFDAIYDDLKDKGHV